MGIQVIPAPAASKTRNTVTLTSGTSWTVPAGVTLINVKRKGGDGGSGQSGVAAGNTGGSTTFTGLSNAPGGTGAGTPSSGSMNGDLAPIYEDSIATTPAASITYAIGAGGTGVVAGMAGYITIEWYV